MAMRDSIRKALLESCLYNPSPPPTFVDYGCMDPTATNYESSATHPCNNAGPNNNPSPPGCADCYGNTDHCGPGTYPGDCCDYPATVNGCTDPTACNYDPLATTDDGTCTYPGCIDPAASNYNSVAGCNDGSCTYDVLGCTDSTANNYDPLANVDDGSCTYDVLGCTDPAANNYDPLANIDDGGCTYDVLGCTDSTACNYDTTANLDDGSCCYDQNGDPCTGTPLTLIDVVGCMTEGSTITITWAGGTDCDNIYLSYNSGGATVQTIIWNTTNTGSYSWTVPIGLSPTNDYYFYIANDNPNGSPTEWNYGNDWNICGTGCTDPGACNYDATANIDDGSCEYTSCEGCIDSNAINYDPTATIDDNSCVYSILGCTDPLAFNYDPLSTVDDGSCVNNLEPCCEWCAAGAIQSSTPPDGCHDWMCDNVDYCPPVITTDNPCEKLDQYVLTQYSNWQGAGPLDVVHFCEKCKYEGLNDPMCKCCKKDPCDKNVLYNKLQQEYNIELPEFCKYCKDGFIQDVSCKCCKKFEKIKKKKPRKKRKKIDKELMGEEIKRYKQLL